VDYKRICKTKQLREKLCNYELHLLQAKIKPKQTEQLSTLF